MGWSVLAGAIGHAVLVAAAAAAVVLGAPERAYFLAFGLGLVAAMLDSAGGSGQLSPRRLFSLETLASRCLCGALASAALWLLLATRPPDSALEPHRMAGNVVASVVGALVLMRLPRALRPIE